mgnify:CR=1 FL=1
MKKKIQFNIPHLTQSSKIFIKKVFEKKNFTDGYFQKKCEVHQQLKIGTVLIFPGLFFYLLVLDKQYIPNRKK